MNSFHLLCFTFLIGITIAFDDKPTDGRCGIDIAGCKGFGSKYCCSYWGVCGSSNDHCTTSGNTPCKCDCVGTNMHCDTKSDVDESGNIVSPHPDMPTPVSTKYYQPCTGPPKDTTDRQLSFISKILFGAQEGWWDYGVLPSLTIAQGILESGWGSSGLTALCNSLFGIKSGTAWKGESCLVPTQEYLNGEWVTINDYFRGYPTWDESVKDHAIFLAVNSRYKNVLGQANYKDATQAIWAAGYATDPSYPSKLNNLIESYALWQYDNCCDYRPGTVDPPYGKKCTTSSSEPGEPSSGDEPSGTTSSGGGDEPGPKSSSGSGGGGEPSIVLTPDNGIDIDKITQQNDDAKSYNNSVMTAVIVVAGVAGVALIGVVLFAIFR